MNDEIKLLKKEVKRLQKCIEKLHHEAAKIPVTEQLLEKVVERHVVKFLDEYMREVKRRTLFVEEAAKSYEGMCEWSVRREVQIQAERVLEKLVKKHVEKNLKINIEVKGEFK